MRNSFLFLTVACVASCGSLSVSKPAGSTAPTSPVNETLSIKDLVASLPPYSYHECSIEQAKEWLKKVKIERVNFRGSTCDSIVYPADGCAGKTQFYLNRTTGKFWEQYSAWEPGTSDHLTEYDVVNGGLSRVSSTDTSPPIPPR